MQHNLQQQDSDKPVTHRRLTTVICTYHSLIHAFRCGDTTVKLKSETFLEIIFILCTIRSSSNPRFYRKKETEMQA